MVQRLVIFLLILLAAAPVLGQPAVPRFKHVFVVVEENQSYSDVVGNTVDMPYLNSLADKYGLATNYFANTHPSINNYFYLTAGRKGTGAPFYGPLADLYLFHIDVPSVASVLSAEGKTWKAYAENLPHIGYIGGNHGKYVKRHDPFAYYENVREHKQQRENLVPLKQLAADIKNDRLPDYGFIVPNIYDDGHNDPKTHEEAGCGDHAALQHADQWLQTNVAPLIASPAFQDGGLLVITFDEACDSGPHADLRFSPTQHHDGGGRVATILVSPLIAPGTKSDVLYHHQSTLRLTLEALGANEFPGAAAKAPDMSAFFSTNKK